MSNQITNQISGQSFQNNERDRRQFYRISDRALIDIKIVDDLGVDAESQFDLSPTFSILREFHQLDVDSRHLLRQISDKDKSLGLYLKGLNSKLDALARGVAFNNESINEAGVVDINISEGGFSAKFKTPINANTPIVTKLILLPSFTGLILKGEVISCEQERGEYNIHIKFYNLDNFNQQLIARHIIRKQGRERNPIYLK
jgi:PilZ domain-containing protein